MRVLVCLSHSGYARNLESMIRGLASRGHDVAVATDRVKQVGPATSADPLDAILATEPRVERAVLPEPSAEDARRLDVARSARLVLDYLRYLEPPFLETPKLMRRAEGRLTAPLARLSAPARTSVRYRRALADVMRSIHHGAVPADHYLELLRRERPDIVVITPLLELGSSQHEQLRAARALGIPTVLVVHSWDNLTTKGLVHIQPDLVAVWNDAQAREAVDLLGLDADRIVVTGAQAWDHWFDWQPSSTREIFCSELGLDANRPFVVYLGSSSFIAPDEAAGVLSWIEALRDSRHPELADIGLVVRPHPTNPVRGSGLSQVQLEVRDDIVLFPRDGENPTDERSRRQYFDTLHHATAVVGVNTSAFLESAILGKPVHTVLWRDYRETQKGTVHFRHLLDSAAPLLRVATSLEEHARQLAETIREPEVTARMSVAFVASFIRPHGRDTAATPLLLDAIESVTRRSAIVPRRIARDGALSATALACASLGQAAVAHTQRMRSRVEPGTHGDKPAQPRRTASSQLARRRQYSPVLEAQEAVEAVVDRLVLSGRPVMVGPWTGELGYELLYWIPMIRWAVERRPELADRIHVVSRGGTASWYGDLGARYVDILSLVDREQYVLQRSVQKQRKHTQFDASLMTAAQKHFGFKGKWLHPSALFTAYFRAVKSHRRAFVEAVRPTASGAEGLMSVYRPLDPSTIPRDAALPERYVAVRFYHRESFPSDGHGERWVRDVLDELRNRIDVVLLDGGAPMDEHRDVAPVSKGQVPPPESNLERQTGVIAHAQAFVGTYGGLSYLAPMLGKSSLAFSSADAGLQPWHEELARAVFDGPAWGRFEHLTTRDIPPTAAAAYACGALEDAG